MKTQTYLSKNNLYCSDLHLTHRKPSSRKETTNEEWLAFQAARLNEIKDKALVWKVGTIYIAGDIFDTPRVSEEVIQMFMAFVLSCSKGGIDVVIIVGNHDLPYHSMLSIESSSVGVLKIISDYEETNLKFATHTEEDIVSGYSWEEEKDVDATNSKGELVLLHTMCMRKHTDLFDGDTGAELLKQFPNAKTIIVGHNHDGFLYEKDGRYVVNCGCIMRESTAELNYEPSIWIHKTDNKIERVLLSDDSDMINRNIVDSSADIENTADMEKMLAEMKTNKETRFDFISVLSSYINKNEETIGTPVVDFINNIITKIKEK